ncbi:DNA-processing protein DprA [Nocardia sp. XZ_19_385]|uniref:DNA-processing protein DprA n=1 Tax=Nocardia sp. XZ_19_385 TaxID=2769488 RepID=UPI00188F672E|nr:DNA-processing protein DprA [Nocardia sp. XZ_19_385]
MTIHNLEHRRIDALGRSVPASRLSGMDSERVALVALLMERPQGMSWSALASEIAVRGSAVEVWDSVHPPQLVDTDADSLRRARDMLKNWSDQDFDLVTILDSEYPVKLSGIHQMPPILFIRGKLLPDETAVSIVGSRAASERGLRIAGDVARGLVNRNIAVLSGLAKGIDAAAHAATIEAGGRPIGVIGTGINHVYPAANRDLHARVAATGALVSQFLPDAPPQKQNFPTRNATMSGLGMATVVVEAGEKSGARIQARLSIEHGRPVVLTDLVADSTDWGREFRSRPGVYVASSLAEMLSLVEHLTSADDSMPMLPTPAGERDSD